MIFLEPSSDPSRRMPPRSSFVNQYLLPAMVLSSVITCSESLPLLEMSVRTPTTEATPARHHRHGHRHHNVSKECPFGRGGLIGDRGHCCKHGGVPVMDRCACPRNFGGDYCELRKRNCLHIAHGDVFTKGCSLCTCQYGIVSCITRAFKRCSAEKSDENDDGRMLTYDMRSRQQKQNAIRKYPMLLTANRKRKVSSGGGGLSASRAACMLLLACLHLALLPAL